MNKLCLFLIFFSFSLVFSESPAPYSKIRSELLLDPSILRTTEIDTEHFIRWNEGRIQWMSDPVHLYTYSSEGVDDTEWGCAWRAIQTALASYEENVPGFVYLYENFGGREFLEKTAEELYVIDEEWIAPHESWHMWADPFVGQMILHDYGLVTELVALNGIVASNSPSVHQGTIDYTSFKERVEKHFQENGCPIVIDNGTYAMNILGAGSDDDSFFLLIGDPHLILLRDEHPLNGLYIVELDVSGSQISIDYPAVHHHFDPGSYTAFQQFGLSNWMILFSKGK